MSLMEEANASQEISQSRSVEPELSPFHLRCRASPILPLEDGPIALNELPIEVCVVSDNDHRVRSKRRDCVRINPLSRYHFVSDASDSVISAGMGFEGSLNDEKTSLTRAILSSVEFDHCKFDDFVMRGVEPRRFDVEQNASPGG